MNDMNKSKGKDKENGSAIERKVCDAEVNMHKMISLYFKNLPDELYDGMNEFAAEYEFAVAKDEGEADIKVNCEYTKESVLEIVRNQDSATVKYCYKSHIFRAVGDILRNMDNENFSLFNKVYFDDICVMIDFSQGNQATKTVHLKKVLLRFAAMGISSMMMYLEDGYEIEGEPYFGYMRPRYTQAEIKMLDDYAYALGMEIVPCIQTLGHLSYPLRWGVYNDIKEDKTTLLVGSEKTYELIRKMLIAASAPVRTKKIHIGMDEAFNLGLGEYLKKNGYKKSSEIIREHLDRVLEIAKELQLEPMIWIDMFFRAALKEMGCHQVTYRTDKELEFGVSYKGREDAPAMVIWDYFSQEDISRNLIKQSQKLSDKLVMAGATRNLHGFGVWHTLNIRNANNILPKCKEQGIRRVMSTVWGDNGPEGNHFGVLLGLQHFAEHGFSETVDMEAVYERFEFCAKCDPKAFEALELFDFPFPVPEDTYIPPCNYSRTLLWQDPMLGLFDANVAEFELEKHYSDLAVQLEKYADENPYYKKFFAFYAAAAQALAAKADLGIKLHKMYKDGAELAKVEPLITRAIDAVKKLHNLHRDFWFTVNNPMGWEIFDLRYGAVLCRLETALLRFKDYCSGKIPNIPELEEKQLYYNGAKEMPMEINYPRIVSASHVETVK